MSEYKHPAGGNISERGPIVCNPAQGVVTIIQDDNSTIDLTPEQAIKLAADLIWFGERVEPWPSNDETPTA